MGDIPWQVAAVVGDMPWQVVVEGDNWQVVVVGDNLQSVVVVVEDRHRLEFGVVVDTLVVVESDYLKNTSKAFVILIKTFTEDWVSKQSFFILISTTA